MSVLATSTLSVAAYTVLPYVALSIGIAGLIWRKKTDRFGWTARSTELLESRILRFASMLFHFGVLAAIGGHVLGILIPQSWTEAVGLSDEAYHVLAVVGGISAGAAVLIGFAALMYRRIRYPRVRVTTTRMDVVTFVVLGVAIVTGMLATLINIPDTVHYRESVAPYFRQIFVLNPEPSLMEGVNWVFQTHVIVVWFLYALWPFSRLIHAFTVPVGYVWRSPIVYRPRRSGKRAGSRPYGSGAPDYSPSLPSSRSAAKSHASGKTGQPL